MPRTRESGKEHRNRKRRTSDAKRTFQSKAGTPCGPARYRRWQIRKRTPNDPGRKQRTAESVNGNQNRFSRNWMRSGWQSRREGPATQRNEALFESFLQRRDLWPPGATQPILISDFTTPSVPFRIQRAPCCVVLHLLSLRWSLRSSARPRSTPSVKTTDFFSVGGSSLRGAFFLVCTF